MAPLIGFIGQGWIGKQYADDFEHRGYTVVRYSAEEPYHRNARAIGDCEIVFVAVPTPTTPSGFDASIVREVLSLVGFGKTAVVKSTLLPGTTESLQAQYPDIAVIHAPEFLSVATAKHDAKHPTRNIIGIPADTPDLRERAQRVLAVLPPAPYSLVCSARAAEFIKYGRNCLGFVRVVFVNLMYDLARELGVDWEPIRAAMAADPDCGPTYVNPIHKSGRGAGGGCFIKDFEALARLYAERIGDPAGDAIFATMTAKNLELLVGSGKDLDLVRGVHGERTIERCRARLGSSSR